MPEDRVLTTDDVSTEDRIEAWHAWIQASFCGLESELYGDAAFDGRLATLHAGEVVLTLLEADRHRVIRRSRQTRTSGADYLKIVAPLQGVAALEQLGRQTWVRPGGWAIYDTTDSYRVANPEHSRHLIVMLPKARLIQAGLRLDALMGRHMGGHQGISRVALETLRSVYQELPTMTPAAAVGAGHLITDLVRLSLQEAAGRQSAASMQAALRDRIQDYVSLHLREPDLSIATLAIALNCSKRHLHNAFAGSDDTLAHYILGRRLQEAMRELRLPAARSRSVGEIGLSWGFSSVAYFSKVFREHVGMTPGEYRDAGQQGLPLACCLSCGGCGGLLCEVCLPSPRRPRGDASVR